MATSTVKIIAVSKQTSPKEIKFLIAINTTPLKHKVLPNLIKMNMIIINILINSRPLERETWDHRWKRWDWRRCPLLKVSQSISNMHRYITRLIREEIIWDLARLTNSIRICHQFPNLTEKQTKWIVKERKSETIADWVITVATDPSLEIK